MSNFFLFNLNFCTTLTCVFDLMFFVPTQIEYDFLRIHNGGSDKDATLWKNTQQQNIDSESFSVNAEFTGNTLPPTINSLKNQLFISFTSNSNGAGKGFNVSFEFGKKVANLNRFKSLDVW